METTTNKTKWVFDPAHSEIAFKVKHLMITNVKGVFKDYEGNISTEGDDFRNAEINFQINPASIDTADEKRDAHLKSPDFFDVENFKQITFTADSFKSIGNDGSYELYGDLTIKGIKKRVKLDVEFGGVVKDPWGNTKAGFTLDGKINRKDWGLNWNAALEAGGVLVSDEVRIQGEIELAKL